MTPATPEGMQPANSFRPVRERHQCGEGVIAALAQVMGSRTLREVHEDRSTIRRVSLRHETNHHPWIATLSRSEPEAFGASRRNRRGSHGHTLLDGAASHAPRGSVTVGGSKCSFLSAVSFRRRSRTDLADVRVSIAAVNAGRLNFVSMEFQDRKLVIRWCETRSAFFPQG